MSIHSENNTQIEFEALNKLRILVLGDVMIDSYLWGTVDRMSPEAPVPVVSVQKREKRLGGAANVAKNLKALGVEAYVISVIGKDTDGDEMIKLFEENELSTRGIIQHPDRVTTIKHRIISDKHLLRVDSEQTKDITTNIENILLQRFKDLLDDTDCVIFQDYNKGVLSSSVIKKCITLARNKGIPITVDPKKNNFSEYRGVSLFKPNLKEINEGLGLKLTGDNIPEIIKASREWLIEKEIERVLITLSEHGALLVTRDNAKHVNAHKRNIIDVSGAGDTVISIASAFIGTKSSDDKILQYSNLSGGLVCEKIGVVPINKKELLEKAELLTL